MGYTPDGQGDLVTNCFACHGGHVMGDTIMGLGNSHFDLTTLVTDILKLDALDAGRDPESVGDTKAPFNTPFNFQKGGSNAVIFAAVFEALAEKGRVAFNENCAKCHGRYDDEASYPNKVVALEEVGTDPVRLNAISRQMREFSNAGWLQYFGEHPVDLESEGYIAQPLDGIWATAPYLHNGSIPTLYHLFNVDERPVIWRRNDYGYDWERGGILVMEFEESPGGLNSREGRMFYNTERIGNSSAGHTFPDDYLSGEEKIAVMEYLKTL